MEWEKRDFRSKAELRGDDDAKRIAGLGAPYYREGDESTEYRLWGEVYERYMPGCFDRTLREDDIRSTYNHDLNQLLGRTKSGTLALRTDDAGLHYEVSPSTTRVYQDVSEMIARGDVDGASVWMQVTSETWRVDDEEREIREINEVRLFEVGPVADPAYKGTSAENRFAEVRSRHQQWKHDSVEAWRHAIRKKKLELIKKGA